MTAFAVPAWADITPGETEDSYVVSEEVTWTSPDIAVKQLTIEAGAKLNIGGYSDNVILGQNAVIDGTGTLNGTPDGVADLHGIKEISDITIDASSATGKTTNIQIGAAQSGATSGDVTLTMTNVRANEDVMTTSKKHYLKVAPQFVRENTTSSLSSAKIVVNNSVIGHSLFGGALAIGSNTYDLSIENSEIVIEGHSAIGRSVYAGGGVWGKNCKTHVENARVVVKGGDITGAEALGTNFDTGLKPTEAGYIYGGGLVEGNDVTGSSATVGHVEIVIEGGSLTGIRGGGRFEDEDSVPADNPMTVSDVDIKIVGDAGLSAIGEGGVTAGGAYAKHDADQANDSVSSTVTAATVTLENIESAISTVPFSGEGAASADVVLNNVKGDLGSFSDFDEIAVDANTSVTLDSFTAKENVAPKLRLTGDWTGKDAAADVISIRNDDLSGFELVTDEAKGLESAEIVDGKLVIEATPGEQQEPDPESKPDPETPQHHSSGGGCSAGFGALALLAALPLLRMRKK